MKKTSLKHRKLKTHFDIVVDFLTHLSGMFPDCDETKDALLYTSNVVLADQALMQQGAEGWIENMKEPLKKGCAKYMKAVESLTGVPACMYHAFTYRDVDAMSQSSTSVMLAKLKLDEKLRSDVFDAESRGVFWDYMDELTRTAYDAMNETPPVAPSRQEISDNIAERKRQRASSSSSSSSGAPPPPTHTMVQGISECCTRLCHGRGTRNAVPEDALMAAVSETATKPLSSGAGKGSAAESVTIGDACREHDPIAFVAFCSGVFGRGGTWDAPAPTSDEWELVNKIIGLSVMQSAIPAPMMSGIESVANMLARDFQEGKTDLSSLNMESIGQKVLSGISPAQMAEFAQNMDKILPALGHLRP